MGRPTGVWPPRTLDEATPEHWAKALENDGLVWRHVNRRPIPEHERDDAYQDGLMGLVRAAMLFDETRGFTFSTYADAWVVRFIQVGRGVREGRSYRTSIGSGRNDWRPALSTDSPLPGLDCGLGEMLADVDDPEGDVMAHDLHDRLLAECRDDLDREVVELMAHGNTYGLTTLGPRHGKSRELPRKRLARLRELVAPAAA